MKLALPVHTPLGKVDQDILILGHSQGGVASVDSTLLWKHVAPKME